MAVIDAILVFGNQLQGPNAVLNAAVPRRGRAAAAVPRPALRAHGLWRRVRGRRARRRAGGRGPQAVARRRSLVFGLAALWDLLFLLDSINTLPATVPIAAALIVVEVRPWLTRRRPGISTAS